VIIRVLNMIEMLIFFVNSANVRKQVNVSMLYGSKKSYGMLADKLRYGTSKREKQLLERESKRKLREAAALGSVQHGSVAAP
jgi:hypothetical protein